MKKLHSVKVEIPVDVFFYEEADNPAQYEQNKIKMKELVKQYPPEFHLRFLLEDPENERAGRFFLQNINSQVFPVNPDFIPEKPDRYLPLTGLKYSDGNPVRIGHIVYFRNECSEENNYGLISFDQESCQFFAFVEGEKVFLNEWMEKKYGKYQLSKDIEHVGSIFSKHIHFYKEYDDKKEIYITSNLRDEPIWKEFIKEFDRVIWLFKEG